MLAQFMNADGTPRYFICRCGAAISTKKEKKKKNFMNNIIVAMT